MAYSGTGGFRDVRRDQSVPRMASPRVPVTTVSELAQETKRLIELHGWCRESFSSMSSARSLRDQMYASLCLTGAARAVLTGVAFRSPDRLPQKTLYRQFLKACGAEIGLPSNLIAYEDLVSDWNDACAEVQDVIDLLDTLTEGWHDTPGKDT